MRASFVPSAVFAIALCTSGCFDSDVDSGEQESAANTDPNCNTATNANGQCCDPASDQLCPCNTDADCPGDFYCQPADSTPLIGYCIPGEQICETNAAGINCCNAGNANCPPPDPGCSNTDPNCCNNADCSPPNQTCNAGDPNCPTDPNDNNTDPNGNNTDPDQNTDPNGGQGDNR